MKYTFQKSSQERSYGYWSGERYYRNTRKSDVPDGHSIVYLSVQGESWLGNLNNRHDRPHQILRPYVIKALKENGIPFENIRWSQRAGCSCPCSPGWIIQKGDIGKDYWMEVKAS